MNWKNVVLTGLVAVLLIGCGYTPGEKPEPVNVSGTVLLPNGQPARDVTVNFFPTSADQIQGGSTLKDGKFNAKLTPGKYTFPIEGAPAAMRPVPAKYHSNSADHSFDVSSSGASDMTLRLTN